MLSDLEASQERLGLSGYGISMTTLEDVFMKTGSEVHKSDTMYGTVDNSPEVALGKFYFLCEECDIAGNSVMKIEAKG